MPLANGNASIQERDLLEVSELFIDAITEKQNNKEDDGEEQLTFFTMNPPRKSAAPRSPRRRFTARLEALPVAVGGQEPQQEQEDQHSYAHGDGDVPHLHPLRLLLLPPLQVAELAPLPDVARHTAARSEHIS